MALSHQCTEKPRMDANKHEGRAERSEQGKCDCQSLFTESLKRWSMAWFSFAFLRGSIVSARLPRVAAGKSWLNARALDEFEYRRPPLLDLAAQDGKSLHRAQRRRINVEG